MQKTVFHIAKMDCPSEEQLIRMTLAETAGIRSLDFDIPNRRLTVYHEGAAEPILQKLIPLGFDTTLHSSGPASGIPVEEQNDGRDRLLLRQVLAVNFFFFLFESASGWLAGSMGLLADSLDMLADSLVYALALFAVGGSAARKNRTARAAGFFQLALAVWGFIEVLRRFFGGESLPDFAVMIAVSLLALAGNALCLYLLQKSRSREAHMQASMIFTSNDVIANLGVITAGVLTLLTDSRYPDLAVGTVVFALVARGAVKILRLPKNTVSV